MNAYAACLAGRAEFNFGPQSTAPVMAREFFTGSGVAAMPPMIQADMRLLEDLVDSVLVEKLLDRSNPDDYLTLEELNRSFGR